MNTRFEQIAGLTPQESAKIKTLEELIGRLKNQAAEPERFAEQWRELARGIEGGVREELQMTHPAPRILERAARPVLDPVGRLLGRVEVYRDLTAQRAFHSKLLQTEKQARTRLNQETARTWKIVNPQVRNGLGEPVGYKLFPGDNSLPFASADAWWRKRAGFVENHVWVTPYREAEKYGAGDYPNQSLGGEGLVQWTEQDRSIDNTDIVLWYTFSHVHIPRPEDYPVMPTAYIGFLLKPNGFFDANPALDVPVSPKGSAEEEGACH